MGRLVDPPRQRIPGTSPDTSGGFAGSPGTPSSRRPDLGSSPDSRCGEGNAGGGATAAPGTARAGADGATPEGSEVGVTVHHLDTPGVDPQLVADQGGEGGLVTLAVG